MHMPKRYKLGTQKHYSKNCKCDGTDSLFEFRTFSSLYHNFKQGYIWNSNRYNSKL